MRALQRDRPVFNQVWAERFGDHRSAIEASDFGRTGENARFTDFGRTGENARFMVEAVAFRG
jgi:2-iminobutanoate/2-iminopropanoate deaminase